MTMTFQFMLLYQASLLESQKLSIDNLEVFEILN